MAILNEFHLSELRLNLGSRAKRKGLGCFAIFFLAQAVLSQTGSPKLLMTSLRARYGAIKGAELRERVVDSEGQVTEVKLFYKAPSTIRAIVKLPPEKGGASYNVYSGDGHMVVTGDRVKPYRLPFNPDLIQLSLKGDLEMICLWDWRRQLSTGRGDNFERSALSVSSELHDGKAYEVLEEKPGGSSQINDYTVDPKLGIITRFRSFDTKTRRLLSESVVTRFTEVNPSMLDVRLPATLGTSSHRRYRVQHIGLTNKGVRLAGELYEPLRNRRRPLVVIAPGSGPSDKDDIFYQSYGDALASRGIAAVVYDKRGVGQSDGKFEEMPDLRIAASDAYAFERWAKSTRRYSAIGIAGLSQGGTLAVINGNRKPTAFVVMLSGSGVSMSEVLLKARKADLEKSGLLPTEADSIIDFERKLNRYLATGDGYPEVEGMATTYSAAYSSKKLHWDVPPPGQIHDAKYDYYRHIEFDPMPSLQTLPVPMLAIFGDQDDVIPIPQTLAALRIAEGRNPPKNFVIRTYAGAGHTLSVGSARPRDFLWFSFPANLFDDLSRWIHSIAK